MSLVDLNEEGKYQTDAILNGDRHLVPVRLAANSCRIRKPSLYALGHR